MKLYDALSVNGFHTSFITTFGIDFDAYESICLSRLRGAGCNNNFILADKGMLSYALDGASALPQQAGKSYVTAEMTAPRGGVCHSKLMLRFGRRKASLLVGSANMTAPGFGGNREILGLVECGAEDGGERQIIAAAWSYISGHLDPAQECIARQIDWMHARCPWLAAAEPGHTLVEMRDGSLAAFLTNDAVRGSIGQQFVGFIGEPVRRMIVVSPYWDPALSALKTLHNQLRPKQTFVLIEPARRLFPVGALKDLPTVKLADISALESSRFFHAKAIIVQTAQADHILFGSANCSVAALGGKSSAGINDEACLYRRLPRHDAVTALGIETLLTREHEIARGKVKSPMPLEDLDLDSAMARNPGRFECVADRLLWWPPANAGKASAIELLDAACNHLAVSLAPLGGEGEMRRFRMTGAVEKVSFARLRHGPKDVSAIAIISVARELRENTKEARSRKVEAAAAQLAEETNEGFWLLEVVDILEAAEEPAQREKDDQARKRSRVVRDEAKKEHHGTLDYDRFIAGRRFRGDSAERSPDGLAGSELSLVRGYLNRLLGIETRNAEAVPESGDDNLDDAFDMGDETSDGEDAIESGQEFAKPPNDDAPKKSQDQLKRERRAEHADEIIGTMQGFEERIRDRAAHGTLNAVDVLRLRALIVIVSAAGWSGSSDSDGTGRTSLQSFPISGGELTWPRILGRALFAFFGGTRPAIRDLQIDSSFDELTADIKEAWATSYWAVQACLAAAGAHTDQARLAPSLEMLALRIYATTQLHVSELTGPEVLLQIRAMSERYAKRLGVDAARIEAGHAAHSEKLRVPPPPQGSHPSQVTAR